MLTPIVVSEVCFPFLRLEGHHMMWRHGGTWHGGVHQADKVAQQDQRQLWVLHQQHGKDSSKLTPVEFPPRWRIFSRGGHIQNHQPRGRHHSQVSVWGHQHDQPCPQPAVGEVDDNDNDDVNDDDNNQVRQAGDPDLAAARYKLFSAARLTLAASSLRHQTPDRI